MPAILSWPLVHTFWKPRYGRVWHEVAQFYTQCDVEKTDQVEPVQMVWTTRFDRAWRRLGHTLCGSKLGSHPVVSLRFQSPVYVSLDAAESILYIYIYLDNVIYFKSVLRWEPAFAFGFFLSDPRTTIDVSIFTQSAPPSTPIRTLFCYYFFFNWTSAFFVFKITSYMITTASALRKRGNARVRMCVVQTWLLCNLP